MTEREFAIASQREVERLRPPEPPRRARKRNHVRDEAGKLICGARRTSRTKSTSRPGALLMRGLRNPALSLCPRCEGEL